VSRIVGWLVAAGAAVVAFLAWLAGRRKSERDQARAAAEHNDQRADAAEAAVDQVVAGATERQLQLETERRNDAQARIDTGSDGGAFDRMQERWHARAEAERAVGRASTLRHRGAAGSGTPPVVHPSPRRKR
jgi:hypothetical protein